MSFSNPMQFYFLCKGVFHCSFLATGDGCLTLVGYITCKRKLYMWSDACKKKPHTQFNCVFMQFTCKFTCIYAASTSCRIHVTESNKAPKLRVTSSARCRLTYLQFACEFNRGVIAHCLLAIACFFGCDFGCFCLQIAYVFP